MKQEQNELGYTRTYAYDAVNNLTSRTDRNGRTVSYGYDHLDRRTSETFGSSYTATYSYDLADQLTQASDGVATYGYAYDKLGRATTVTSTLAGSGVPGLVTFTQGFDLNGNRTQLSASIGGTMSAGADFVNQYRFDALNRLTRVTQAGQTGGHAVREKRVDFAYFRDSQWQTITRYQDLAGTKLVAASTFGYDPAGRLQGLTHAQNATTLAGFSWTYDTLNRVKTFTDTLHPAESATYAYDTASQLTGADRSGTANDETYSYDANGNRSNYTTGLDNRLQSDGTYTYLYDNEGNRTRRTKTVGGSYTEYTWDHRNRLTSVTDKTASGAVTRQVFYTYDVFDRRVAKQVDWDGAGAQVASKEYYFYDGQHIAIKFVDPDASGAQPSALRSRLLHGPVLDQILADEVLTSMTAPGNVLWPLTDNLGTVRDIVDFTEATDISQIANHLAYDAFGRIISETNAAVDSLFAFTGRERDEESWYFDAILNGYVAGHYYYRGRFYDPVTGRFLSQDPIGFEAGDTSFYRYVGNQPTSFIDPEGLERRRHIGFVYIAENPTLDQWYVGKADVLDKRLTMSHKHAEFLTHPDTRIQLKPITAECDPTKPTRRQRTRILLDAEQAELDAKGGKSSSKSLNGKNELTVPEKRDAVRSKFKPRTGKGGVVKAGKTAGKSTALNLRKPSGSRLGGTGGAGQEAFSLFVGVGFLLLDRKRINDEVFGGQATGSDLDHYQLTQSLLCEFLNLTEHDLKPGHFGGFYRNPFTSQWEKAGQSAVENLMLGSFPGQFWAYDRETNSLYTIGYDEWHEMHEYKER